MIPIKLTLSNFMPYRGTIPTLDFTGIHTASICGDNGSGKSAIIDAMTWALWGETRTKKDDDLIHQGQNETEVDFEFAVGQQRYRVLRKHSRPKRRSASGQSSLNFQIAADGGFRAIDGDTMTQTQQKIADVLHMDYHTFTNSAYLRQGHADEFTTSSPAKRKEVLTNILGLSLYDELEEQAKDLARQRETEKQQLERTIADIDIEMIQMPSYEAELQQALSDSTGIEEAIRGQELALIVLRQNKEILESKKVQLVQIEKNIAERSRQLTQWQEQVKQLHLRIKEHEGLIGQKENIEIGYGRFVELRNQNEIMNRNLSLFSRLNQKKHELEMTITRESQVLIQEHRLAQSKTGELEKTCQELPRLREELAQAQHQLKHITLQDESLLQKKQFGQELLTQISSIAADKKRLEKEIQEITEKLLLLQTQKGASCPVCGNDLGENGLKHIEEHYDTDRRNKTDSVKTIQTEIQVRQAELKLMNDEISSSERSLAQERAVVQGRLGILEREIHRAAEAGSQLSQEKIKVQEIEERLSKKEFAINQQEQLQQIDMELGRIAYDPQSHEKLRPLYDSLRQWEVPKQRLEEAERLVGQEKEDVTRFEKLAQELQESLEMDSHRLKELTSELVNLPEVAAELLQKENGIKALLQKQKQAQERMGSIKGKLDYLMQLGIRKKEKESLLHQSAKEEQVFRDLGEAFGKKGVQALIIETALPEIENEANRLLAKMTDNRMNVKIETQRETQKGDTLETLDIKISDELGTRNYEMFSGGEAFRINFSIRIALSRLLARRKGAPLPTLIIDEGFGTQDTVGIEKLREAITSIQDDFEKILVITHIEELRDAFPARIDVIKTVDGSTITLN